MSSVKRKRLDNSDSSESQDSDEGDVELSSVENSDDSDMEHNGGRISEEDEIDDDNDDDDGNEDDTSDSQDGSDDSVSDENTSGRGSTFEPPSDELDKAKAVTSQLRLWEHLLRMRVNLQKAMVLINQLPQCERLHELISEAGEPCQKAVANGRGSLKRLLDQLLDLESMVLAANPETKNLLAGDNQQNGKGKEFTVKDDDEITSESEAGSEDEKMSEEPSPQQKRTVKASEFPQLIAKRHKSCEKFRNGTIQKWADKTQSLSKFAAFDQSISKQIQQTLTDKVRLVARTRINRLGNKVIGKPTPVADPAAATTIDQDDEIFDDNDLYHHILREFIQYKNSYDPIVLTKQWLEIQQFRKKVKKNVDRKASKGRKTRYNVHKALINFMAPVNSPDAWTNDQRDDLFKNLFGKAQGAL